MWERREQTGQKLTERHVRELSQIVTIWVALELAVIDFFKIIF